MKKYISKILVACALTLFAVSCDDDATLTTLTAVNFPTGLTASPNTVAISTENKNMEVTALSWPAVHFPIDAPVTYSVQFDIAADTLGSTAWAHALIFAAGENVMSKSFSGNELNDIAHHFGLQDNEPGQLVVRVSATMDRTVYSNGIVLTVTPFTEVITMTQLYVPGAYQGWNPATAATLQATESGIFQGLLTFPAGSLDFKFTPEANWDTSYGYDSAGNFVLSPESTNLSAPAAGTYQITVNLNTMTFTLTPYAFGIIGTATAGGWNTDTDMSWDYQNHKWVWTGDLVPGALKFRLNDSWTINYGADANGTVMYLDNQGAHNITQAGNYTVTFAVNTDPATATYSVTQN